MLVREDAADGSQGDKDEHKTVEDNEERFAPDVLRQVDGGEGKNGGDEHRMARRERRLAGAVRAGVPNEKMIKNEISDHHEGGRDDGEAEVAVDFGESFARGPLIDAEQAKNTENGNSSNKNDISDCIPIHDIILSYLTENKNKARW